MDYKLINEYKQQGKTYREIMKLLDIPCNDHKDYDKFRKRVKRNAPKYLIEAGTPKDFTAYATSILVDAKTGEQKLAWVKSEAIKAKMLSDLMDEIHKLPPLDFDYEEEERPKMLLEIPLFDMHFGVANFEHYRGHLKRIIGHIRKKYDHIVITVGSDMLHHNDMRSQTAGGTAIEQINIRQAWGDALRFYMIMIRQAVRSSNKVTVIYVKGNHDESLSWAFTQLLKQRFPMVELEDSYKERKVFLWEKIFIGYTHGDKPIKDIDKKFTSTNKQAYANSEITEIHIGHTHKEVLKGNIQDCEGVMVRVLSTGAITDDWHDSQNYVGSNKRFQIFEYGPDRLLQAPYIYGN